MERLQNRYKKLLLETDTRFHRYMYNRINWNNRMIGLTGPRGIGKTTLVLQYIKENLPTDNSLYVTAEDFYFADHRLLDLADTFVKSGGKHLFIDEIHRYNDWSRELKLIYDYHPELQVVFTGSSELDINKGISDLSRRAAMYHMQGLSFREYLQLFHNLTFPVYSLAEILQLKVEIPIPSLSILSRLSETRILSFFFRRPIYLYPTDCKSDLGSRYSTICRYECFDRPQAETTIGHYR